MNMFFLSTYAHNVLLVALAVPLLITVPWIVEKLGNEPGRAMVLSQRVYLLGLAAIALTLTIQWQAPA
jgi:hypothetical protein